MAGEVLPRPLFPMNTPRAHSHTASNWANNHSYTFHLRYITKVVFLFKT